ncbi:MAG: response regulator [Lentimonas sp.]
MVNESQVTNTEGARILVVDDDAVIRKLSRRVLELSGLVGDEADSGEVAIKCIEENTPDLRLLDVMMDEIDGFITCRQAKAQSGMNEVPIIFVTGRSDTSLIGEGLDAHKGRVFAQNRDDRIGARFTVELDTTKLAVPA